VVSLASPFDRKRRRGPFGDDIDDIFGMSGMFDQMFQDMQRMMDEAAGQPQSARKTTGPYVRGFSMRIGQDGKPVVQEFGNVSPPSKEQPSGEREPLVDVIEQDKDVVVIAEVPGVEKHDIKLKTAGRKLAIRVDAGERKYFREVELPVDVKADSAKATYKNGVLEVRLERKAPRKEEGGSDIKVE